MRQITENRWYRIPEHNGYEIHFTRYPEPLYSYPIKLSEGEFWFQLVSWKNRHRYPNGYILPYEHYNRKGELTGVWYELTDLNNKRERLKIETIVNMIRNCDYNNEYLQGGIIGSRNSTVLRTDKKPLTFGDLIGKSSLIKNNETSN